MLNDILSWCKENYEKVILGVLAIFLLIVIILMFSGINKQKELANFKIEIQPPQSSSNAVQDTLPDINLDSYISGKPMEYYKQISDRAVFFPIETKKPVVTTPDMNLECLGITSTAGGMLVATLKNSKTNTTYNVRAGEQVENFMVVSVSREVIVLSGSDGNMYSLSPPAITMPFKLTGIMPTDTGSREAMLQNEITRKTYFLKEGDKVENWDVLNISENAVIISKSDAGKYELKIGGESQRIQE